MEDKKQITSNNDYKVYYIPVSIIIAGIIIAGSTVWVNSPAGFNADSGSGAPVVAEEGFGNNLSDTAKNVNPVSKADHVRGNPKAKVTIIEYSDFECPFCSRFHPTVMQVLEEFSDDVNWVYRHFPLTSIHPSAMSAAIASECAGDVGGNDAFWGFTDKLFSNQHSLGNSLYTRIASEIGLSEDAFSSCLNSGKYQDKVRADMQNATDAGGRGTPFSVIVTDKGDVFPFSGALPYENVRALVVEALKN